MTVDPEPPQPNWLVQSNLLNYAASLANAEPSQGQAENQNVPEIAANLLESLMDSFDTVLPTVLLFLHFIILSNLIVDMPICIGIKLMFLGFV